MLRIRSFAALRPQPEQASSVAALPYDVMSSAEARVMAAGKPMSFLHISKPEIDLAEEVHLYEDQVYAKAAENFATFQEKGWLQREAQPQLYLYRQIMGEHAQVGVVACCHIDDYAQDVIKKHEKTRQDKEDDRTRHVITLNANAGPVFLTYRDDEAIDALVAKDMGEVPLYDFTSEDGVRHSAWRVSDAAAYMRAFGRVPAAYVADGHHRSASAARAGAERRKANPQHTGEEEYNWFLAVLFPASQLRILPYNRLLRDLNGHSEAEVLGRLGALGTLTPTEAMAPSRSGAVNLYVGGRWYSLVFTPESIAQDDPIASLDVSLVQERILAPIFGILDPRTDHRVDFVGGIRGPGELVRRVDSGEMVMGISMYPTRIDQLLAVSDAGLMMPPKSTWFEPKLRSGLFVHSLD